MGLPFMGQHHIYRFLVDFMYIQYFLIIDVFFLQYPPPVGYLCLGKLTYLLITIAMHDMRILVTDS